MLQQTPLVDLNEFKKNVFSQNGEDGMLQKIFELIPPTQHYCVEFGAADGLLYSNVAYLFRDLGWQGLFIEASGEYFQKLQANYRHLENVKLLHQSVTAENIETIFEAAGVPQDLDLLSIDIDGNDYWVWKSIVKYQPKVVVIEYNAYYEPTQRWVMKYNPTHVWDGGTTYHGASLESLYWLGKSKGYELVCCDEFGVNAFFVKAEYYPLFGMQDNSPSRLFFAAGYGMRFIGKNMYQAGHIYRYGPYDEI